MKKKLQGFAFSDYIFYSFAFTLLIIISICKINFAQTLDSNLPVTNGAVTSMLKDDNTLYLGGVFNYIGPSTGRGVELNDSTGIYNSNFPKVNGTINVCVSDSQGGWYIGGEFTKVGNSFRNSAAHILADGTVDSWNPNIRMVTLIKGVYAAGVVETIVRNGNTFYFGGEFDHIGDSTRNFIGAYENGNVTGWNPDPNGPIFAIVPTDSVIYFGGTFSYLINHTIPRTNIAAVDPVTNLPTAWAPDVYGGTINLPFAVYGLCLSDTTLYVWGNFNTMDYKFRYGVGALYTNNTIPGRYVTPWNPQNDNWGFSYPPVYAAAFAMKGDTIFIGGNFTRFGPVSKSRIAAVSKTSGQILLWKPNVVGPASTYVGGAQTIVNSLSVNGNTLYAGGSFYSVDGLSRNNLAAFNLINDSLTNWNPNASDEVNTVSASGNNVYAGGNFTSVNGVMRNGLAAIDLKSKSVLSWNPNVGISYVNSMVIADSVLYAGGYFSSIGGDTVQSLAAINKYTGSLIPGMPNVYPEIQDLLIHNNQLYIGGTLFTVGDSSRYGLASIDLATKKVTGWNPNTSNNSSMDYNTVYTLALSDSTLFIGGSFGNVGDSVRQCLAALNINTGSVLPWEPTRPGNIDGKIRKIAVDGNLVYVGGGFTTIGGTSLSYAVKIDRNSGVISPWNSQLVTTNSGVDGIPGVNDMTITDSLLYLVGPIGSQAGSARQGIAEINLATDQPTNNVPYTDGEVYKLVIDSATSTVYVGGFFSNFKDESQSYFAGYIDPSLTGVTSVQKEKLLPQEFSLNQNYPNPFNPSTNISYTISKPGHVKLQVFNVLGQIVSTLVDEHQSAGSYSVTFDAGRLASGVYYYRLSSDRNISTKKMLLLK